MFNRVIGGTRVARLVAAALVLCAPATMARAANPATPATASANIIHPLTVTKLKDMDFGDLSVSATTAGTAVLEPNADAFSTTGGVAGIGGTPHSAEFLGAAQSNSVVNIKVPNQPSTLTRVGGTQTIIASKFTLQGQSKRALAKAQSFTFRVGATLTVPAGQVEGTYVGTFDVTVQYP